MRSISRILAQCALLLGLALAPTLALAQQPAPVAPAPVVQATPAAKPADPKALAVGSVIQLKSGGPKMTIIAMTDGAVRTQWYNTSTHVFVMADFPQAAVKLADDDDDDDEDDEDDEDED